MAINAPIAYAFDQHTISDTALGLVDLDFTQAQVDDASRAVISVRSGSINIRYDGTAPTIAIGHTWFTGDTFAIVGRYNTDALQIIRNGASDAVIDVTLEK
ncbi:MAG: hypothetical protein GTO60_16740 [Gammaproteobacteria bacterium]|nr:hypothetical protein [Gammaproteobacteria bacterium]